MSFSPLDGLTMGTRCGQLDAAVVLYLLQAKGMTPDRIATLLYRESGLLGLSGLSNDMRELQAAGSEHARQAIDHFVERIVQGIGTMAAALRGVDGLVFTGGIGENAAPLRERVLQQSGWLGIALDAAANCSGGSLLTRPGSAVTARVLRTDEEAVIARHTARLLHL
jgi:acetate kinase